MRAHGSGVLPRLRDAYLEPWTGDGHTAAELRQALRPAGRLAALGRVGAWGRLFSGAYASPTATGPAESASSLLAILDEPPV
ncbi:hypothetical protein ACFRI7_27340 [Streptomyces sp. NPDC056716]|uniref:hypothetical protein n=1 Tax=unclassified Streptomyces TaxID=2593676 RepID=UPI003676FB47